MRSRALAATLALLALPAGAVEAPSRAPQDPAAKLKPYAQVVRSRLVSWHEGKREIVIARDTAGAKRQVQLVTEPGAVPKSFMATPPAPEDGKPYLQVEQLSPTRSRIWIVEGASRKLVTPEDKADVLWTQPVLTNDGKGLYVITNRGSDYRRLAFLAIPALGEKVLSAQAFDVDEFAVSTEGTRIAYVTNEGGAHALRFYDAVAQKELPRPPLFSGVITGLQWRPGAREVAFNVSSARVALDVFSYDYDENQLVRWTNGNSRDLDASRLPEPRLVNWKAADGKMMPALAYLPSGIGGKLPVLVEVHGPASEPARAGFLGPLNYVVNSLGIAVIRANVRGDAEKDVASLREWIAGQAEYDGQRVVTMPAGRVSSAASIEQVRRALLD